MFRRCNAVVAAAALLVGVAAAQDQPTFRSGVHIVEVDVRVFDTDGRFVTDLTRDDFEILESGVPQQLQTLFLVNESGTATVPAKEGTATVSERAQRETVAVPMSRQTWIFVFDINHLTPGGGFDRARQAVEEFIRDRFKDGDLAGVVAGSKMINNRLTSVREELVGAVKQVRPLVDARNRLRDLTQDWPRIRDAADALRIKNDDTETIQRTVRRACDEEPDLCRRVPPDLEIREKARIFLLQTERAATETLTALNALASGLAKIPGPKTIVLLTDGFVTQERETTLRSVVGQTSRSGSRIYAIDVRGLNRGRGSSIIEQGVIDPGGPPRFDLGEDGPTSLAVDTGGLMIRNENNLGRALDRIAQDSGSYYVLGYQPANTTFDGKFRPIEVRVKRPGVRVRARRGYLALEPSKMTLPQPIEPAPAAGPTSSTAVGLASPTAVGPGLPAAAGNAPEPPPPTAAGTIVAAPGATAGSVRIRPSAAARVESLAAVGGKASAGALADRGWEAYQRGDVEAALTAFTEAAAQPDVRPWVLYALGLSQIALGRPADAVVSWERVRQAAPDFAPVYLELADTYVQLSDLSRALATLRDAEKRWPKDAEIHSGIGVVHARRGAFDDAIAAFSRATEIAPEEALGFFNLARAYELRFARSRRYVSSQRRWFASEEDRRQAAENYRRCVKLGGPYASQAAEALSRLEWTK